MTLGEFKAWFEGFSEGINDRPSEKQWKRIKARVAEINDVATPYPVYIDRYVRPYPWLGPYWYQQGVAQTGTNTVTYLSDNSTPTWQDAGRAEYQSLQN